MNKITSSIFRVKNSFIAASFSAQAAKLQGFFDFHAPQNVVTDHLNLNANNLEWLKNSTWGHLDFGETAADLMAIASVGVDLGTILGASHIGKVAYTKLLSKGSSTEKQLLLPPLSEQAHKSSRNSRILKICRLAFIFSFLSYKTYVWQKYKASRKFEHIPDEQVLEKTIDFFKREVKKGEDAQLFAAINHFGPNPNKTYEFKEYLADENAIEGEPGNVLRYITNDPKRDSPRPSMCHLLSRFNGIENPKTSECIQLAGFYKTAHPSESKNRRAPENNLFTRFETWANQSIDKHRAVSLIEEKTTKKEDDLFSKIDKLSSKTDKTIPFWLLAALAKFTPHQVFDVPAGKHGVYQCTYILEERGREICCIPKEYWNAEVKKVTDPKMRDYLTSRISTPA